VALGGGDHKGAVAPQKFFWGGKCILLHPPIKINEKPVISIFY